MSILFFKEVQMAKKTHLDVVTRFSSDSSSMSGDIAKIQDKLNKINLGDSLNKSLQSTLQKLEKELSSFQQKANAGISDKTDLANLEKSFQKINGYYKTHSPLFDLTVPYPRRLLRFREEVPT